MMMKKFRGTNAESGQIAIITVVIFMIMFSIVVVSFTRIVVAASRQTVNDELRAKAIAAAQAGIEDAKRVLTYCYANSDKPECSNILGSTGGQECTELIRKTGSALSQLVSNEDITLAGGSTDTYQVKVGEGDQYYQCLQIATSIEKLERTLDASGSSQVIPLTFRNIDNEIVPVKSITIEWHDISAGADGPAGNIDGTDFPSWSVWTGNKNPATVRAELVTVPNGPFKIDDITNSARAWTMRPSSNSGALASSVNNIQSYEPKNNPNEMTNPLLPVRCSSSSPYACSFTFCQNSSGDCSAPGAQWSLPSGSKYYLRLQAIYRGAKVRISAHGVNGEPLYFSGVQANIDVTGRSGDSFQRINADVKPNNGNNNDGWYPEYAIDSGGKVCKDLVVSGGTGEDKCPYN